MEISKINLTNFKPYYATNSLDLSVNPEQNIILIGGRNGQGKTSLLIGVVWCMYGKYIVDVDKIYNKAVKGNYPRFLDSSLNRKAKREGFFEYEVSIQFESVELSDIFTSDLQGKSSIKLIRRYNASTSEESFTILIDGKENQLAIDEEDKIAFVDNYLIPRSAAKFVFFDAEKISEIAELSIKEQGKIMNDALGKILGLEKYENLIKDIQLYRDDLRERGVKNNQILREIESFKNKITLNDSEIINVLGGIDKIEDDITECDREIRERSAMLARLGAKGTDINIDLLEANIKKLEENKKQIYSQLSDIAELVPFAIAAGKLAELLEQIELEQEHNEKLSSNKESKEKSKLLLDDLFNKPPFPEFDMDLKQKIFYYEKGDDLFQKYFSYYEEEQKLPFFHDLSKSTIDHLGNIYAQLQSNNNYQQLFSDYIRVKNDISDLQKDINRAKSNAQDPDVEEWKDDLLSFQRKRDSLFVRKGAFEDKHIQLEQENKRLKEQLENKYEKVHVSQKEQTIIDEVNKYILALRDFLSLQKKEKCSSIEKNILLELRRIMHKKDFVDTVSVLILPNNEGMEVTLIKNGEEVPLPSSGERQIYVSCLLKAILMESVVDLPVFIDTPLGRLDHVHKNNLVENYYPYLSNQVIILTTDEEITVHRKMQIDNVIANTFLLINEDEQTRILNQYFS